MGLAVFRIESGRLLPQVDGGLMVAQVGHDQGQCVENLGLVGLHGQGLAVALLGFGDLVLTKVSGAQKV